MNQSVSTPRNRSAATATSWAGWFRFRSKRANRPYWLIGIATLISLGAAIPFGYLLLRAFTVDATIWQRLFAAHIPGLIGATLALVFSTVLTTLVIVERTDIPWRAFWRIVLALPLAIPAYVAALCWIMVLRRGGLIEQAGMWFGLERGSIVLPPIYNLFGATLAISLCVYPYIYLPVAAALRTADHSLEEAARLCGRSAWGTFCSVTLPQILPAAFAGTLLVGLYVFADFGTVSMLRYRTFTLAIYQQFGGSIDRSSAAVLSLVLVVLVLPLVLGEHHAAQRNLRISRDGCWRPRSLLHIGRWCWVVCAVLAILIGLALFTPLLILASLSIQGWFFPTAADRIWQLNNDGLARFGAHSVMLATVAATIATMFALAPAYLAVRFPSRFTNGLLYLSKSAFALPGIIVGLSFVFVLSNWVPALYGTLAAVLFGFVFRLLPQAVATNEAALRSVTPVLEQAARTMGSSSLRSFMRITMPLAGPGLIASWLLIFITAMKELPTAILLRPPGFDTLSVRIWAAASESVYTQAAQPAFLLILLTMACLLVLTTSKRLGLERTLHDLR
jgi:iron(III) transport system permease protein